MTFAESARWCQEYSTGTMFTWLDLTVAGALPLCGNVHIVFLRCRTAGWMFGSALSMPCKCSGMVLGPRHCSNISFHLTRAQTACLPSRLGAQQLQSDKACTPMARERMHASAAYEMRLLRLKLLCCIIMGVMGLQESLCGLIVAASANPIGRTLTAGPTSGTSIRSRNKMSLMCGHALVISSAWLAVSPPLPLPVHHATVLLRQRTAAAVEQPRLAEDTQS